ncbi:class I SAM-dependent methyltransferase [Flavobacterium litorale]|uniref:Class I SAM-dependent methyltransferase n=1 Tax=Flavobacterium litorale TaxID=2856519 RepID=A0ABX8V4N8_9FLAO|nr:class I SAM-dependent methyltransferase [Flavobacterium litorale]QYJ67803.1 class I SAM-dependent methyltransferase [Flavobacterium litorale]
MENENNYLLVNKAAWNSKTAVHINSDFYDMPSFLKGKSSLNSIELELLGDVKGKKILHLQCHFGQDTLSLARMGAIVTGVDLSDKAIEKAQELSETLNIAGRFICCDVYSLPEHLDEEFDIVFTSYGTIGWLPDMEKWASIVSRYLKPKGQFIFADFHPVVWMFDDAFTDIAYSYFNKQTIFETIAGSYTDNDADISTDIISWNHSIADVLSNLLKKGLQLKEFKEYDYSPYDCLEGMEEFETGKFRIKKMGNKIPMVYALRAEKTYE